ncbi:TerD family protein [Granulosicoccus antarcticus]|uniref:General stress protein 16U n=1 Tax=Granulosicoccus antarcticus IMCC3135 TaxID=1192854 RepID=A0A2Z2NPM6_9GAMM|nr:TerD family protein [Granulosicoccus antarcticus]ASJ70730.1 General stress protein 16U [Granulosicoccus antarcticus IMCC3135]
MPTLAMGANAPISSRNFTLDVHLPQGAQIDVAALQLYAGGKVRGDDDMCFYNQPSIGAGALSLQVSGDKQSFTFDLDKIGADVEKIVVNATLDSGVFSSVSSLKVSTTEGIEMPVDTSGRTEAALILCEVYKRNDQWKIRNVSQGFNGGLQALAEHFGVEVAAAESPAPAPAAPTPAPTPAATPAAPASSVNLDKVSLTKNESSISLKKDDGKFGRIRVNLNWNQKTKSTGLFGMGKRGIDLDLGAFVEFKNGEFAVIQALGKAFGDLDKQPFVKLMGDDRTGTSTDGEWLEINGDAWPSFRRVLIFAFIYQGAANWQETDGVIRMMVPGQPEVEVRMNELNSNKRDIMCAVALLENNNNQIRVNREVSFFGGHEQMDKGYGWGMKWRAGRK